MKTPSLEVIGKALSIVAKLMQDKPADMSLWDDNWFSINLEWDLNVQIMEMFEKQQPHLVCDLYYYDWKQGKAITQEWYTVLAIQWEKEWNQ